MADASAVIARVGTVPVLQEASLRSEQVTQLVLGETADVLQAEGDWRRVRLHPDRYEGWVHAGYLVVADRPSVENWRARALGWSDGAVVSTADALVRLPLRARVTLSNGTVILPDGRSGRVVAGRVAPHAAAAKEARAVSPEQWAVRMFAGTPYQWGGVTPWGADCSGMVQTVFLARGVRLPRDASQQSSMGRAVAPEAVEPGDLLFFSEKGDRISHVALSGREDTLVHSTLGCGGFVVEPWTRGSRAAFLRDRLVAVRRVAVSQ